MSEDVTLRDELARVLKECEKLRRENARLRLRLKELEDRAAPYAVQLELTEDSASVPVANESVELPDLKVVESQSARHRELTTVANEVIEHPVSISNAKLEYLAPAPDHTAISVSKRSAPADKIALFRSLFRGREDVYPARWKSKEGKSGYSPVCQNEWSAVCKKPKMKCADCSHKAFVPVTDAVIHDHLDAEKNRTIGVYPMLPDETCFFLAVDFDKRDWTEDIKAFLKVCDQCGVPAAVERSRSGNGGHVWIFFEEAIPALLARRLGAALMTGAMEHRHVLSLDSYDRMFPNQDTMPKGGFGNLIALPLQGLPRKQGNSVFVDTRFQPIEDQWAYLSSVRKMSLSEVECIVQQAAKQTGILNVGQFEVDDNDESFPWEMQSSFDEADLNGEIFPSEVTIVLANMIFVEKSGMPAKLLNRLVRMAAFPNPEFYKAQAMRLSTFGKPRVIGCAEDYPNHIAVPRGCYEQVIGLLESLGIKISLQDERNAGERIEAGFMGELTMMQDAAARAITAHETGILSATTAFGKTVVGAAIIARRRVNTLVLVHRRELMEQWKERLAAFLDVPAGSIGVIGGGKDKRTGKIDIAVMQSINVKGNVKSYISEYGQIIVDECHHVSAFSFEQILKQSKAKFVFGLTATPARKDGHQPIVYMQCGPIRFKVDAKSQARIRPFTHKVIPKYTSFKLADTQAKATIQEIYQLLTEDEARNEMIFDDLLKCLDQGRSPLLLTERTAHVDYFEKRLAPFAKNVIVLRGGIGKKERDALKKRISGIPDHEERVFIATGKLIGEGFDDARLDTLFLVLPVSWKGTLQQYAGRLHRLHEGKKEVQVYDYVDLQVPMLSAMYKKRIQGYRAMGYTGAEL